MLRLFVHFHRTPDDIEAGVAACRARAQYVGQEDRIFPILLGEQALNTHLGGPEVMRGQLRRLLDAMDLPGLSPGIIPARAPPWS
ncbi:Scr1 family TA system antitoxin-like transcriptional regulator [Streptomyces tauricus]